MYNCINLASLSKSTFEIAFHSYQVDIKHTMFDLIKC